MRFPFDCPYVAHDATYRTDRYYRYAELTDLLTQWTRNAPGLAELSSIGKTLEGRDIWCVTLTNFATGPAEEKPAYYIDANLHAGEVAGSAVALFTIRHVLNGYGSDAMITRLMDESALYVVPRVAVDGAERYLTTADSPRSSVRPYPDLDTPPGLRRTDLDGDGWITTMRIPDPDGPWKVSAADSRLMVRRSPDETGGNYYWVLPEGLLEKEDGLVGEVKVLPWLWGLDLNRNFPVDWEPEAKTRGAGDYPLSEPETRAVAEFLLQHRNISGTQHYHTFSGVILRPASRRPDTDLLDLNAYEAIGAIGEAETGYPCVSLYHDFTVDPRKLYAGMLIDWVYDHLGALAFSTELWSLANQLGLQTGKALDYYFGKTRPEADDLAMLKWVDEHLNGFGFVPWKPFQHPQFGAVEIGGWQTKFIFQNPPGPLLESLCLKNAQFTLRAAAAGPRIRIRETRIERLDDSTFRVEAVASNGGFLPTSGTRQALSTKRLKPDALTLRGLQVISGPATQELGWMPGRIEQYRPPAIYPADGIPTRRKATWIVKGSPGSPFEICVRSQRGGTATLKLTLA